MGMLPAFFYLILALVALAVAGILLVWIIRYVGSRDGNPRESPNPGIDVTSALAGEQELLRVLRTQKGELAIYIQGQRHRHLREITDPQVGRETIEALKAVLAFAEGWLPASPPTPVPPPARKSSVDEEAFLERLRRANLFAAKGPSRPSSAGLVIPAEAINELVQERLQERPDLAAQPIRLSTESDGRLRIDVGLQSFESVGDIPESAVRSLIQDAIREWESGYPASG